MSPEYNEPEELVEMDEYESDDFEDEDEDEDEDEEDNEDDE